jgi:hypothetical protein
MDGAASLVINLATRSEASNRRKFHLANLLHQQRTRKKGCQKDVSFAGRREKKNIPNFSSTWVRKTYLRFLN